MVQLSIIIPAYNEANRIGPTLEHYSKYYSGQNVEIIVVPNGCTDNTVQLVQTYEQKFPNLIRCLSFTESLGKGGAVKTGLLAATGQYRGFVDADESTTPAEFDKLVMALDQTHSDGVIASRWLPASVISQRDSFIRKLASGLMVWIVRRRFHMPFHDTQCGAKVFTVEFVQQIVPQLTIKNLAFDVELLYKGGQAGYTVVEVPTVWIDKSSSTLFRSPLRFVALSLEAVRSLLTLK